MGKGIDNLMSIVRADAVSAREAPRALAIYPSRTPAGADSRSGLRTRRFFGDLETQFDDSERTFKTTDEDTSREKAHETRPRIFASYARIAMRDFKTQRHPNPIESNS